MSLVQRPSPPSVKALFEPVPGSPILSNSPEFRDMNYGSSGTGTTPVPGPELPHPPTSQRHLWLSDWTWSEFRRVQRIVSQRVLVVSLRCRAEVAYERIRARDPDFVRRERCPSVEHYRRGFYDPYCPKGIRADLVIDTESDDQQATLRKVLERVPSAGAPTLHEASGLSLNASV